MTDTLIELLAEWELNRRAKKVRDGGGASADWSDCMQETKDSFILWATKALEFIRLHEQRGEISVVPDDVELVRRMCQGARLSPDKQSNRNNMRGALMALKPYLRESKRESGSNKKLLAFVEDLASRPGIDGNGIFQSWVIAAKKLLKEIEDGSANG